MMRQPFLLLVTIIFVGCEPPRPFYTNFVKLNAVISDTAASIPLGDTLKVIFIIPDSVKVTSSNGTSQNTGVSTLQEGFYTYSFMQVDTITHSSHRLSGIHTVISKGYGSDGVIYVTNTAKPFVSILSLIPPAKGIYYLQITQQPGSLKINNSVEAGLAVNFAVSNKHWFENAVYFNGPNQPDFITSVTQADAAGYGFYCFRVN